MTNQGRAVAFDVDPDSLERLGRAFPGWTIDVFPSIPCQFRTSGPTAEAADLLVVGAQPSEMPSTGLCQVLRARLSWADTPLLVLVPSDTPGQVEAFLNAGANSCLVLPIQVQELVDVLGRARAGNRPGHHTGNRDKAHQDDLWQDDGGEG
jgi:DNA-binding response OmpR family regulator